MRSSEIIRSPPNQGASLPARAKAVELVPPSGAESKGMGFGAQYYFLSLPLLFLLLRRFVKISECAAGTDDFMAQEL